MKNNQFSIKGSTSDSGLFGQQLYNGGKYVTITEGEIDALSVYQLLGSKYAVVSIKNGVAAALKDIKKSYDWLDQFDNIVINFDNDDVGREASKKVAELFAPSKVKILKLPEEGIIQIKSSSRIGVSDLGVNQNRINKLYKTLINRFYNGKEKNVKIKM